MQVNAGKDTTKMSNEKQLEQVQKNNVYVYGGANATKKENLNIQVGELSEVKERTTEAGTL